MLMGISSVNVRPLCALDAYSDALMIASVVNGTFVSSPSFVSDVVVMVVVVVYLL